MRREGQDNFVCVPITPLIDIETGAWEMDANEMSAVQKLEARLPDPQGWMVRIGYPSVHCFGAGRKTRVA